MRRNVSLSPSLPLQHTLTVRHQVARRLADAGQVGQVDGLVVVVDEGRGADLQDLEVAWREWGAKSRFFGDVAPPRVQRVLSGAHTRRCGVCGRPRVGRDASCKNPSPQFASATPLSLLLLTSVSPPPCGLAKPAELPTRFMGGRVWVVASRARKRGAPTSFLSRQVCDDNPLFFRVSSSHQPQPLPSRLDQQTPIHRQILGQRVHLPLGGHADRIDCQPPHVRPAAPPARRRVPVLRRGG